uniref:Uncharacterized protein n=1 Tax=Steinernema glaseri TaxID=37863 RepID=A0A1I7YIS6_9BILA
MNHRCEGQYRCSLCNKYVNEDFHNCYQLPATPESIEKLKKDSRNAKRLYFDVDTVQNVTN